MNTALLVRSFREARWLLLGSVVTIFGFCMIRAWIVGRVEMSRFQNIVEILRPEVERYSAVDVAQLFTYPGRVGVTFNEPLVVLLMVTWAIARGSDSVSGPLGRGTMEMMLAQPISRFQLLFSKSLVTVVGCAVIATAAWLGTHTGVHTTKVKQEKPPVAIKLPVLNMKIEVPFTEVKEAPVRVPLADFVDTSLFIPSAINLGCLGVFFAGLTTWMSSWDRYRWRTIGIVTGFLIVQMIVRVVSLAVDTAHWLKYLTIFTLYEPEVLTSYGVRYPTEVWTFYFENNKGELALGGLSLVSGLLLGGAATFALGHWIFCRRDLPAPV
ncbi:ABC transporter permease subunit [Blastopirellula sp. JC732]|uniref:ABC transporter permease subunit n=1 Tax=Blastopirellula sediminis TaxID=2894196 RepID=A0A9X1MNX9_9BACT|nr:ABC transporter permease subunit [Blastopirellula sediminis]MCC9607032.1 ABC transporter permease subunit [Blastopirellula sediminis]MCC9629675.1 ABC transporter permease subunit [Blastopirellula sediminis]